MRLMGMRRMPSMLRGFAPAQCISQIEQFLTFKNEMPTKNKRKLLPNIST